MKFDWDWDFAFAVAPKLAEAMKVTVAATLLGMAIALSFGLLLAVLRRASAPLVSRPAGWFVEFVRSTPLLVQIYFLFYVLPDIGPTFSPFATGVLALGVHYACFVSEVYRAGIDGVGRGQWEAAAALNLSPVRTFVSVILPQAIPPVVPALGNYLVAMFKKTPLLSTITVSEVFNAAREIGAERFRYLEPITIVGVLFLLVSLISAWFLRRLELALPNRKG